MATKTAKKPVGKSAAKASAKAAPQASKAKPITAKNAVKPVTPAKATPLKHRETAAVPHTKNTVAGKPGWCTALQMWWAFIWRYLALGISVWLLIGVVMYGVELLMVRYNMSLTLNADSQLYRVFQLTFSEYVRFMVTWVVLGLLVRKQVFRGFTMQYAPAGKTEHSTSLDGVVPLAWSLYWRLLIVRLMTTMVLTFATVALMKNEAAFKTVLITVGMALETPKNLLTVPGLMVLASVLLLTALYSGIQVAVIKNLIARTGYKTFNLTVSARK